MQVACGFSRESTGYCVWTAGGKHLRYVGLARTKMGLVLSIENCSSTPTKLKRFTLPYPWSLTGLGAWSRLLSPRTDGTTGVSGSTRSVRSASLHEESVST